LKPLIAVLAAGKSSRFGSCKIMVELAGKPLGRWALEAAQGTGFPVVWIGSREVNVVATDHCEIVQNHKPELGLSHSLSIATDAAQARSAPSLLIMLADMPLISPAILKALARNGGPSACQYADGKPGVPAFFPENLFVDIRAMSGDRGAGLLLAKLPHLALLPVPRHALLDVDTPADLSRAERVLAELGRHRAYTN